MHVLHGTWLDEHQQFAFWGEDTTRHQNLARGRRGRLADHPFTVSVADWLRYLDRHAPHLEPDGRVLTVWLPGMGKHPTPSPEAQAAGMEIPDGPPELLCWRVTDCITLRAVDALDLLLRLPRRDEETVQGTDFIFWRQVALLAINCVIEGRYIPALEWRGRSLNALWQPVAEPEHLADLADAMPPLCRAVVDNPEQTPRPADVLNSLLRAGVDGFVREALAGEPAPDHRWLKALTGPDKRVSGSEKNNRQLYDVWHRWQAVLTTAEGAFRVCFRLDEPEDNRERWSLRYYLQAVDDPGTMVPAHTVWHATGQMVEALENQFDDPQEKLLAGLGLAARLFEPIERSLHEAHPTEALLTRDEVFTFLTEVHPLLEQNRFGVLVPNWWKRAARLKARVRLTGQAGEPQGFLSRDNLARYKWDLSLGGQPISREEFEELVALKQPLVQFHGEWVTLDPRQVEAALRFFEKQEDEGELGLLEALRLAGSDAEFEGLEVESVEVEGWLEDLFERLREPGRIAETDAPEALNADLRPYQSRGFNWLRQMRLAGLGACLADDMGLGKTIQTIALLLHERHELGIERPALVVCPTSVLGNWRHEIQRFSPSLRVLAHHGPDRAEGQAFVEQVAEVDVVLTTYALLSRDRETLAGVEWANVVLDEAQNIKNPSTKRAQAARALQSDHRLALTGTPIENRLSELWSIFQFLNPGYLGSQKVFRSAFGVPIERYQDQEAAAQLRRLTSPFVLRRVKSDPAVIQDLPDKFENKVHCTLTTEQATLYEAVVRDEMELIEMTEDGMQRRGSVLRMLTRLKQVCNHPAHFLKQSVDGAGRSFVQRSGKLDRLVDMVDEVLEGGEKALIFTQYAEMGHLLYDFLRERFGQTLYLHGGTPSADREDLIRQFQAPHGPALFILSLRAGGTGLNLTRANHVFHFDRWYNPAVEDQATDRAYRIGQTKDVQVHKFVCLGTLEERIDEMIEHKKALADSVVGTGEGWISEMNDADLRELVTLRRDVVED